MRGFFFYVVFFIDRLLCANDGKRLQEIGEKRKKEEVDAAAECLGHSNDVHAQMPNDLNISFEEAKDSTRPAWISSCDKW